ncbi:hypothetical protein [Lysinibacillus sp. FSL W8-0992]|uniref:hypothetical protein n=1 Tax=Lysinibacillus sp. FSL W8-0992 TaxID=2954643 RepID=UPI0030FB27AF
MEAFILNIEQFRNLIEHWNIEKQTIEQFWIGFNIYRFDQEDEFCSIFGEFIQGDVDYYFIKISLELRNFPELVNQVVSYLSIEYKGENVGEFRVYFNLDGKISDFDLILY